MRLMATAALAAGLFALPAHAQSGVAHDLSVARCIVDNDATRVNALLHNFAGAPGQAKTVRSLVELYGACDDNKTVDGTLSWRERAAIAHEAALAQLENGKTDIVAASSATGWTALPGASEMAAGNYDKTAVGMLQFGICAVKAAPEGSLALLRSAPGSAAETAAIRTIAPVLQTCLPSGQQFTLKRADLRLVVAEPIYEMLTAGSAGTQR